MDLTSTELIDVGLDALAGEPADLPDGIADRLRAAALERRRPLPTDDATAAFIETATQLLQLLDGLTPEEWERPTTVGGGVTARELVMHLVGVERYLLGQLGRRPAFSAPGRDDHFPATRAAAAELAGADGAQVARTWWLEAMALVAACAELGPDHEVAYHHLGGSVRGMLVVRTFELWTHDDDIRRAVGAPRNDLDADRLSLMSSALLDVLPFGLLLAGTTRPGKTMRIVLTGPGGGRSVDAPMMPGEPAGAVPDITIAASTLDLCRVASNRLSAAEIDVVVEGDRSLLEPVLVGAAAFAMD